MSRIRIKNFGPIKQGLTTDDGWMDIKKVTVFIGNQGTGKSTVAKLISTLTWIEKVLVRGDYPEKEFTSHSRFVKKYCSYHRLENYFENLKGEDKTEIEYDGDAYSFKYSNKKFTVAKKKNGKYALPQIMYVPAERNFISTINNPRMIKLSSGPLVEFLSEFENAKEEIKSPINLPLNNTQLEYDRLNDIVNIQGIDYKVRLTEASSGFQSAVPLFLVSGNIAKRIQGISDEGMSPLERKRYQIEMESIYADTTMTEEQKRIARSALSSKFNKKAFVNIVEEPEQNLYPSSQRHIFNSLLQLNNYLQGNKLIVTTHSPYIISYLSLAVKGFDVLDKIISATRQTELDISPIIPIPSVISENNVIVFELSEDGTIIKLPTYEGIPSDSNFLNQELAESNRLFDALLEIEEEL